jgi:hypothetical protein
LKIAVVFEDGEEELAAEREKWNQQKGKEKKSQLTEYFKLNKELLDSGKDEERLKHTYATICNDYWWSKNSKTWTQRKLKMDKLVRIGSAAPGNVQLQVAIFTFFFVNFFLLLGHSSSLAYCQRTVFFRRSLD